MNIQAAHVLPEMGELYCSNHLLGDPKALAESWDRHGYWFFRDVLDKTVIANIRQVYVDYLVELGVVDPNDPKARYNGADLSNVPANSNRTKLNDRKVHKLLHEAPTINAFFEKLFGCDPFWVPITVHRANPPSTNRNKSRFDFIHEDGVYSEGMPFLICWVPLDDIDEDVGGLGVIEGVHKGPCLHIKDGMTTPPIRLEDVPANTWRRTKYRAGDVLLMHLRTPHSGIANISRDRFRFSMDTRIMPSSGKVPIAGTLKQISSEHAIVEDAKGEHTFRLDANSFIRGRLADRMPLADVAVRYSPGDEIIVTFDGDLVINMRFQS